jgi:hypothetical protein
MSERLQSLDKFIQRFFNPSGYNLGHIKIVLEIVKTLTLSDLGLSARLSDDLSYYVICVGDEIQAHVSFFGRHTDPAKIHRQDVLRRMSVVTGSKLHEQYELLEEVRESGREQLRQAQKEYNAALKEQLEQWREARNKAVRDE